MWRNFGLEQWGLHIFFAAFSVSVWSSLWPLWKHSTCSAAQGLSLPLSACGTSWTALCHDNYSYSPVLGQTATQEVLPEHEQKLLGWAGAGALAQAAQRGAGGSSLGISSSRLDVGLGALLGVALLEQGWHHRDPQLPHTSRHSVSLQFWTKLCFGICLGSPEHIKLVCRLVCQSCRRKERS